MTHLFCGDNVSGILIDVDAAQPLHHFMPLHGCDTRPRGTPRRTGSHRPATMRISVLPTWSLPRKFHIGYFAKRFSSEAFA